MGIADDIVRLEQSLRDLSIRYEQYFLGVEKREPLQLLDEVERLARQYQGAGIANTMLKFKYQSLVASLVTLKQKWIRITRLIEEGKYQRDRFKMTMHQTQGRLAPGRAESEPELRTPDLDRVYQEYLTARRSCNLPVENVSREKIAAAIAQQIPAIANKYRCNDIDIAVVIEGGKPRIKARPKS